MNNLTTTNQKSIATNQMQFSAYMSQDNIKNMVQHTLGQNTQSFITAVISAVSNNPELRKCENSTILSAALQGEALKLSPSPILGQYYMLPFNSKGTMRAQFILGAKGYKQLAMRSGQYLDLDVFEIKEGEYKGRDKNTGKPVFEFIEDDDERENKPTIGYMAYLELLNGFRKSVYWSKDKMIKHADTYSPAFSAAKYNDYINGKVAPNEMYKYSSFWYKNFTEMAFKTLLRYLLSQWGVLSIEMQQAINYDNTVIKENGEPDYVELDDTSSVPAEDVTIDGQEESVAAKKDDSDSFDFFEDTTTKSQGNSLKK